MSKPEIDAKYRPERFSKRHHYLPIFYLRGFTDNEDRFHVYDKISGKILESQKPDSKYFEKHLNNYKLDGKIQFTMEEPYFTPQDTEAAPLFFKIRNSAYSGDSLTNLEKFQILGFLMSLYWRLPNSNAKAVELMKKEGVSNKYFGFFDGDKQLTDDDLGNIRDAFLNDEQNQRFYKMAIPLTEGAMKEIYKLHEHWHLYTLNNDAYPLVIGDDPFLSKNNKFSLDQLLGEVIFPLAGNRLLILSDNAPPFLDSTLTVMINLAILAQAERYISCSSKDYLLDLIVQYEKLKQLKIEHSSKKTAFEILYAQAKFGNFEDYLKDVNKKSLRDF